MQGSCVLEEIRQNTVLLGSLERLEILKTLYESLHRSSSSNEGDEETSPAQDFQPCPSERKFLHIFLSNMHLNGKVNSQRPKGSCSNKTQEIVEEREDHCYNSRNYNIWSPPNQSKQADTKITTARDVHFVLSCNKFVIWPTFCTLALYKLEDWLAKDLIGPNKMHSDADIGKVDKPEGLIKTKTS